MRRAGWVVVAAGLATTACGGLVPEGPSNQDIADTTGLTVAEAVPLVADNFERVWPEPVTVEDSAVQLGNGCRTDRGSLRSTGPPWAPSYEREIADPPAEFVDRALAKLAAMTAHGFVLAENPVPGDDPVNRVYRDSRGFSVATLRYGSAPTRFVLRSSSPCAAE
ncbi:hypothetical protein ACFC06_24660 [Nocardia sp. NPDC056064]|uniref:hypothetical protein n=1 Tax=Nocardia sp. NPDC056064 TaxID=3345701 RepID=UPI0035D61380